MRNRLEKTVAQFCWLRVSRPQLTGTLVQFLAWLGYNKNIVELDGIIPVRPFRMEEEKGNEHDEDDCWIGQYWDPLR